MSKKHHQTGKTDQLWSKRPQAEEKAPYKNDVQFLCDFQKVLDEHIQDIQIEDTEKPYVGYSHIEWDRLKCGQCKISINEAEDYLKHILECQFTAKDVHWYSKYGVINKEIEKVFTEAQEARASTSYLMKNCVNTTDVRCKIAVNSPLTPYLTRGLAIHFEKLPMDLKKVIPGELQIGSKTYSLYFTTKIIEKQRDEVMKTKADHSQKKSDRDLRRSCPRVSVPVADVVTDAKQRTRKQTKALNKALGLPKKQKTSQEVIIEKIQQVCPNAKREKTPVKVEVLPPQPLTKPTVKEGKRLNSSFTIDYLTPASAKRKRVVKAPIDV